MSSNVSIVPGLYSDLNAAVKASEWEKVLTISNKVLSESPDEQKAFQCKTAALIHLGKFEDCLHHLKPSRSKFGVEQKFERAYCEYRLNRLAEALASLENCDSLRDQELRAQVLYRLERFNESLALYRSLVRNCADDYGEEREANMAAACAARDTYDQLYNVACALIGRGRLDEAAETLSEAERTCREALAEDDQETLMEELAPIQFQQAYLAQKTGNQQRQQEARKTYQSIANAKLADASLLAVCANNLVCANRDQNLFDSKKRIKFASGDALKQKLTKKQKQAIAMNQCLVYLYSNQAEQLLKSDPNNETLALIVAAQLARERTPGGASGGGGVNASATNYLESLCAQQPDLVQTRIALAQLFAQAGSPRQACEALKQLPPDLLFSDRIVSAVMRLYASVEDRDAVTEFLADARRHYSETEPDDEKHKILLKLSA
uniref:Signal recognition particle subunit SRP72 n=1 Tax=Macrostomum lignano TaxID=282301 RepID=A0A1I8F357_9PLAT